ncbi:unnamed protein product [Rhodiola kirilowii]
MDDFKVVLGLEFHDQVKVFSVPLNNTMCILDGHKACIVPTMGSSPNNTKALSAIQFKKGIRRDEESYLAILKEHDDVVIARQVDMPKEVAAVLEEFKDVLPNE